MRSKLARSRLACGLLAIVFLAGAVFAQDERRVRSPNGQIEFRLFTAVQTDNDLPRIAYEVYYHGRQLLKPSFLGLDIQDQEPLLGEHDGLTSSTSTKNGAYSSLVANYMQDGSLGRLLNIEVRAYDDGVAFRYVIPLSTPLTDLLIAEEATEFRFAQPVSLKPVIQVAGAWVSITESNLGAYPAMHLVQTDPNTLLTRLNAPFHGTTPMTCPWRMIAIAAERRDLDRFTVR